MRAIATILLLACASACRAGSNSDLAAQLMTDLAVSEWVSGEKDVAIYCYYATLAMRVDGGWSAASKLCQIAYEVSADPIVQAYIVTAYWLWSSEQHSFFSSGLSSLISGF